MIDTHILRRSIDLLAFAERDTHLTRKASTGGGEFAGPCPFCGHLPGGADHDGFRVQPAGGRWLCRHCTDGKWQDVIAYIMRRENCDFRRACELLGAVNNLPTRQCPPMSTPKPTEPPAQEWQSKARQVIEVAERSLWANTGAKARDWLHERGLSDDTLRRWHIGCNPAERFDTRVVWGLPEQLNDKGNSKKVWLPRGIVVPCEIAGVIWYVKIRRPLTQAELNAGEEKYPQIAGGRLALFGANTLRDHSVGVLCEGEFDAMLLHQEAGDLAGIATLGSASGNLDLSVWGNYLLPVARLLVAYDIDNAGNKGAARLATLTARARRVSVPAMPNVKDLTDFHKAGGNLRAWLAFALARRIEGDKDEQRR